MTTIGIIGAGNIGSNVARAAIAHGYDVVIGNSRGPETLAELVGELGGKARAATASEAAAAAEFAVVAVPLSAYRDVPVEELAGKIVLDANNYYPQRDGNIAELDEGTATSSELLQRHLPSSRVVKAFNHIGAAEIPVDGLPAGDPRRRGLTIAGDDAEAKARAAAFYDELGYTAVDAGPLSESWRSEPGSPAYGVRSTAAELAERHAAAVR